MKEKEKEKEKERWLSVGVSDKIKALLTLNGKKVIDLADFFGITRQSMSNKMARGSWSSEDLIRVAEFINADFLFEMVNGQRVYLTTKKQTMGE